MEVKYFQPAIETAARATLTQLQLARMQTQLRELLATNAFYQKKLRAAGFTDAREFKSLDDLARLPFTRKQELVDDQAAHPPFGSNLTYALDHYIRHHQTSGTTGKPLRWLDTRASWDWWKRCWGAVYRAASVDKSDRIFFAFSFGPFIGFWSAWAGAEEIGALCISGGAQDSLARLKNILELGATVICCTPSYALHLAEVAQKENLDLRASAVKKIIVAGEPGGSIPGTQTRMQDAWNATVFDHTGATEIGAHGFTCLAQRGVHLNEGEFIIEVIDPVTGKNADEGELVITNLGRIGSPNLRYRTGDQVKLNRAPCECGRTFARMEGGIIGRIDAMLIVRGVNIFPSALEAIVRAYPEAQEFAVEIFRANELDELELKIEIAAPNAEMIADKIARDAHQRLGLRVLVRIAPNGSLPRFELKARRVNDRRKM
ncbi:MAG: phenylacetate--CoA ligase family protein [Chloroflexi bacterium]|nr:phenylacetate--CoA ligase family protein [Chloroflexota bacterium]